MLRTDPIPVDPEGYAIPFAEDDRVIECGCDDPDFGDARDWPSWTDRDRWTLDLVHDRAGPTDQDWDEYARWSAWQDALEVAHPTITDEDVARVTGSAG
jgi:hypothetical protein